MKTGFFALVLMGAALSHSQQTHDTRFRTYGQYNYGGYDFPFRAGGSGATDSADFIIVGALDGGTVGPFADNGSASDIATNWMVLREKRPRNDPLDEYGTYVYESTLSLSGFDYYYKMDILNQQFADERPKINGYIVKYLETHANATEILFEIANEPNAFPAMSPKLFAWYYLNWRAIIKAEMNTFNTQRLNAWSANQDPNKGPAPQSITAKFMPGGLWVFEGMPAPLLKMMDKGLNAYLLGVHFSVKGYPNTYQYYQDFLKALKEPLFCDWRPVPGYYNVQRECYDYNLGNVMNFKYIPVYALNGTEIDLGSYSGSSIVYQKLKTWDHVPVNTLIDVANLHFYPYLGLQSTMTLSAQLAFWKTLVDLAADNSSSGEVWVTEMGNFNPFKDVEASTKIAKPVLTHFQTNQIPKIKRWYWFRSYGEDGKLEELKSFNMDPQKTTLAVLGGAYVFNSIGKYLLTWVEPPLTYNETSDLLHWANMMAANLPDQGLSDKNGKPRRLGMVYNNLSTSLGVFTTPPAPAVNLSLYKEDYREMGANYPPWKSRATLRWEWDRPDKGYDALFTIYANTSSNPSSVAGIAEVVGSTACTLNPSGSSHRYSCAYHIPDFPFGSPIYVRLKGDDFLNSSLSSILTVPHPVPSAPANVYCPTDMTLPLNLPAPLPIAPSDILKSYDVKQQTLSLSNALNPDPINGAWYYTTTAAASDFNLKGAAMAISTDPSKISDLNFSKPAVKVYPDGVCINAPSNGKADFTITTPPSNLNASHYVIAHPPAAGFFELTFQSGSSTRSTIPGLFEENPLPYSSYAGIVYLGDFMQPGETVKSIKWSPAAAWYNTDPNVSPVHLKSITLSAHNPYAPKLSPFVAPGGTQVVVGSETLPVYYAAPGEALRISAGIQAGAGTYTASLDAGSTGKGMTVTSDGRTVRWTPSTSHLGQHVVTLTLKLSYLGTAHKAPPISRKLAIQIIKPEILSVPKSVGTFGEELEITGTGFVTSSRLAQVSLNGALVAPGKLNTASIAFTIPDNTAVGRQPVFVLSGTASSNTVYVDVVPKFTSLVNTDDIEVSWLRVGRTYQVIGAGFGSSAAAVQVKVKGRACQILEISDTRIKFVLPPMAGGSVQVQVVRNGFGSALREAKILPNLGSILSLLLN